MSRGIVTVSIVVAGIMCILSVLTLIYVVSQVVTDIDTKRPNIINTTNNEKAKRTNQFEQHTSPVPELVEENGGRIASLPNKCSGSALCPN
jgi:hypothetical protein